MNTRPSAAENKSLGINRHTKDNNQATEPPVKPASARGQLAAVLGALLGGVAAIPGAFLQELQSPLLGAFIAAPIVEEALKPTGTYILLARWPHLLRGRLYTALLAALGGLAFAVLENILYLEVYFPDHSSQLTLYRYTVNLSVHAFTSFIVGFGINKRLLASVRGEIPLLKGNWKFFVAGMALHSAYNILAATVIQVD